MTIRSKPMLTAILMLVATAAACGKKADDPAKPPPPKPEAATIDAAAAAAPTPDAAAAAAPGAAVPVAVPPAIQAIVDAADRSEADRALDAGRHPGELLAFIGVEPKMRVAELSAGGGYTTELLARAVGPEGVVFGQNNKMLLGFVGKPWEARLATKAMANVTRVDAELEAPLPAKAKDLDLVVMNLFYHDLYWAKVDRAKLNQAVLAALAPDGRYVIVDHSARAGAGVTEVETLHRIEESEVVADVTKAGFVLDRTGDFLRNPADTRDWNASPTAAADKRGTSDRFVLVFKKP